MDFNYKFEELFRYPEVPLQLNINIFFYYIHIYFGERLLTCLSLLSENTASHCQLQINGDPQNAHKKTFQAVYLFICPKINVQKNLTLDFNI